MKNDMKKKKASTARQNNTSYDLNIRGGGYASFFDKIVRNSDSILEFLETTPNLENYRSQAGDGGVLSHLINLTLTAYSKEDADRYAMQLAMLAQYYIKKHNFDPKETYSPCNNRDVVHTHLIELTKLIINSDKLNHFKPLLYVFTEERIPGKLMNAHPIHNFPIKDYDGKSFHDTQMYQYFIGNYQDEGPIGRCDINAKDNFGKTALMYAIENGVAELVKFFLDHGADVCRIKNNDGKSALDLALESNNDQIKSLFDTNKLLEKLKNKETEELKAFCDKINIEVRDQTNTLSHFIKQKTEHLWNQIATSTLKTLKNTLPQDKDQTFLKIIKLAIDTGYIGLVERMLGDFLIDRKFYSFPLNTKDEYGDTILSYAQRSKSENKDRIVEIIQNKGGVLPTEKTVFQILEGYNTKITSSQTIETSTVEQDTSNIKTPNQEEETTQKTDAAKTSESNEVTFENSNTSLSTYNPEGNPKEDPDNKLESQNLSDTGTTLVTSNNQETGGNNMNNSTKKVKTKKEKTKELGQKRRQQGKEIKQPAPEVPEYDILEFSQTTPNLDITLFPKKEQGQLLPAVTNDNRRPINSSAGVSSKDRLLVAIETSLRDCSSLLSRISQAIPIDDEYMLKNIENIYYPINSPTTLGSIIESAHPEQNLSSDVLAFAAFVEIFGSDVNQISLHRSKHEESGYMATPLISSIKRNYKEITEFLLNGSIDDQLRFTAAKPFIKSSEYLSKQMFTFDLLYKENLTQEDVQEIFTIFNALRAETHDINNVKGIIKRLLNNAEETKVEEIYCKLTKKIYLRQYIKGMLDADYRLIKSKLQFLFLENPEIGNIGNDVNIGIVQLLRGDAVPKRYLNDLNINGKDSNGDTPLMAAVKMNDVYSINELLNKKANLLIENNKGETVFSFVQNAEIDVKKLFIKTNLDTIQGYNNIEFPKEIQKLIEEITAQINQHSINDGNQKTPGFSPLLKQEVIPETLISTYNPTTSHEDENPIMPPLTPEHHASQNDNNDKKELLDGFSNQITPEALKEERNGKQSALNVDISTINNQQDNNSDSNTTLTTIQGHQGNLIIEPNNLKSVETQDKPSTKKAVVPTQNHQPSKPNTGHNMDNVIRNKIKSTDKPSSIDTEFHNKLRTSTITILSNIKKDSTLTNQLNNIPITNYDFPLAFPCKLIKYKITNDDEINKRGAIESAALAQLLIKKHHFDPKEKLQNGDTLLLDIVKEIRLEHTQFALPFIEVLLDEKITTNTLKRLGLTSYITETFSGKFTPETLRYLNGAYPNEGPIAICDIDATDSLGKTALMYAIEKGNAELVQMFLEHGASITSETLDLASKSNNPDIKAILNPHTLLEQFENEERKEIEYLGNTPISFQSKEFRLKEFIAANNSLSKAANITTVIKTLLTEAYRSGGDEQFNQTSLLIGKLGIDLNNKYTLESIINLMEIDGNRLLFQKNNEDKYGQTLWSYSENKENVDRNIVKCLRDNSYNTTKDKETLFKKLKNYIKSHPEIQNIESLVEEQKISLNEDNNIPVEQYNNVEQQTTTLSVVEEVNDNIINNIAGIISNNILNEETKNGLELPLDNNDDESNSNRNESNKKKKTVTFGENTVYYIDNNHDLNNHKDDNLIPVFENPFILSYSDTSNQKNDSEQSPFNITEETNNRLSVDPIITRSSPTIVTGDINDTVENIVTSIAKEIKDEINTAEVPLTLLSSNTIITSPATENQNLSDTIYASNSNMKNEVLPTNNEETNDTLSVTSLENSVISPISDDTEEELNNENLTEVAPTPLETGHSDNRSIIGGIYSVLKNVYDSSLRFVMQSLTYVWNNISFSTNQSNNISTDISPIITEESNVEPLVEKDINIIPHYNFKNTEKALASILNNENTSLALLDGVNRSLKTLPKYALFSIAYHVMRDETQEVKTKFYDNIMDKLFDESEKSSILEKVKNESAKNTIYRCAIS